jgi:hypothetical protein
LFNLVLDTILRKLPEEIGYRLGEVTVGALAYADDLVFLSSSKMGMQQQLDRVEQLLGNTGMEVNPGKCVSYSLVPSGKEKKIKIMTEPQFQVRGAHIPAMGVLQTWNYLGTTFNETRDHFPVKPLLEDLLERTQKAPLKPQQRLWILRHTMIPRIQHKLTFGRITIERLKQLDVIIRAAVRRWLHLPKDTPSGYFHAPVKEGGLGIPALRYTIPGQRWRRCDRLLQSTSPATTAVVRSPLFQQQQEWAVKVCADLRSAGLSSQDIKAYWTNQLHRSVDGRELKESAVERASTTWVDLSADSIPGRDYIQHHHVRINALPSRIRTSRGRREEKETGCRAGCSAQETTAHIIQGCWRTHGGRVLRHDAVASILATSLEQRGWSIQREPRI